MDLHLIFDIILLLNGVFVMNTITSCKGYRYCHCTRQSTFECSNTSYIPKPPRYVVKVILLNNYFPFINRTTFRNIASNRITTLVMNNNSIQTIKPDAFSDLQYLKKLEICHEKKLPIKEMQSLFKGLRIQTLEELRLEHNKWEKLPMDMFQHLNGSNISLISLNYNKLSEFHSDILRPLMKLNYLYLVKNAISHVNTRYLHTLQHLDLSDNNIFRVPNFCVPNANKSVDSQRLRTLYITNNAIRDISANSFDCLDKLEILNIDGNRMHALQNNIFSCLPKLRDLSLSKMPQLKRFHSKSLNVSSLKVLIFSQNGFRFDKSKKYIPEKIFFYLTNLKELDLTHSFLPSNNMSKLLAIFSPLQLLRKLVLVDAGLYFIPDAFFKILPNLEILNLMGNKLSKLNDTVFKNVTSLQTLILGGNYFHIINQSSFSWEMLHSLKRFDISDNPFWCTCDQKWFIDTLRSTNLTKKMTNWPRRYRCNYPEHLRSSRLSSYYPTYIECNLLTFIIICVSASACVIFFIVVAVLRCQVNIKNAIYFFHVYRRMKRGYLRLESSDDCEYDVFIVYCDGDRQWVHNDLLQRLETSGSKVCIHHRDFDVGEHITTNIDNFMEKSWKIVVVMSNNFAESEWCQWEVDLILERRRQKGKEAVILIMFQQIDSLHMTSSLRSLLDTTPHLSCVQGFGEKLFWKTLLRAINKSLSFPPSAIK